MSTEQDTPDRESVIDMLAAVVVHNLVTDAPRDGMTTEQMARACERDPGQEADREEVEAALRALVTYDLAQCAGDRWLPTRAAVESARLSF